MECRTTGLCHRQWMDSTAKLPKLSTMGWIWISTTTGMDSTGIFLWLELFSFVLIKAIIGAFVLPEIYSIFLNFKASNEA
jgi:hypothetical protein